MVTFRPQRKKLSSSTGRPQNSQESNTSTLYAISPSMISSGYSNRHSHSPRRKGRYCPACITRPSITNSSMCTINTAITLPIYLSSEKMFMVGKGCIRPHYTRRSAFIKRRNDIANDFPTNTMTARSLFSCLSSPSPRKARLDIFLGRSSGVKACSIYSGA